MNKMENYKEKYEQALERAKVINPGTADYEVAIKIFPELTVSEDEKIRKEIIYYLDREITLSNFGGDIATFKKWIAWLEKQGKQKTGWDEEDVEMIDLLISILEINHPNKYFKSTDKGDVNMRAVPTKKIINWLKSLKQRMKGE